MNMSTKTLLEEEEKKKTKVKDDIEEKDDDQDADEDMKDEDEEDMKETFSILFNNENLSEDFKTKASVIFEAALSERVSQKLATLEEKMNEKFETDLQEAKDELLEKHENALNEMENRVDAYVSYAAAEWMKDNELAVESGLKLEMAENLITGIKNLLSENNIEFDETDAPVIENLENEIESLKSRLSDKIQENIELQDTIHLEKAKSIFESKVSDLSEDQKERVLKLIENIEYRDEKTFSETLDTIVETFIQTRTTKKSVNKMHLDEEVEVKDIPIDNKLHEGVERLITFRKNQ